MSDPIGDRLLHRSVAFLEGRVSRRSLLVKAALAGSALSVAPVRFLTRPVSAETVLTCHECVHEPPPEPEPSVRCADCRPGQQCCSSGYTAFCCQITEDRRNTCPPHTKPGGWWKCTSYRGRRLCAEKNVRYYVDCNIVPGEHCEGGCHCANNDCDNRHTCCTVFKYGQCHPGLPVTAIACRVVKCARPCEIWPSECRCSPLHVDDNTCTHEAACL